MSTSFPFQKKISDLVSFEVPGFLFSATHAGLKSDAKLDLGIALSQNPKTTVSLVTTQNLVCAAPVILARNHSKHGKLSALLVNSGNANAATGKQGLIRAKALVAAAAKTFQIKFENFLPCSTGKIGVPLPHDKLIQQLPKLKTGLKPNGLADFLRAIQTTDATDKITLFEGVQKNRGKFHIAILAKGAGMIAPNMATLLCFIFTDAQIPQKILNKILKSAVDQTLNRTSVDGDTSTNDTTAIFASHTSKARFESVSEQKYFAKILTDMLRSICFQIVSDGEGATKAIHLTVSGAPSFAKADHVAKTIAESPLVKSAFYGCDPNWGRIAAAAGRAGVFFNPEKLTIHIGKIFLLKNGTVLPQNVTVAAKYLKGNHLITTEVNLGNGKYSSERIFSDLTENYVRFNSEYTT